MHESTRAGIHSKLEVMVMDLHDLARSIESRALFDKRESIYLRDTADTLSSMAKCLKYGEANR